MKEIEFRILDLFCGAGGISYGMHKNPHFKTVVASDYNASIANTFSKNMPDAKMIVGDIKDQTTKDEIIKKSKEENKKMFKIK